MDFLIKIIKEIYLYIVSFLANLFNFLISTLGKNKALLDLERYGFAEAANSQMTAIIEMFYSIAQTMFYIFIFIVLIIWAIIGSRNEDIKYPIAFKRWQETLIDIGVLFIPLIIIYYLTIPAIGFILHIDRFLQWNEAIFSVEIIGHQWYWSYYLDSLQNYDLLQLYFIYHLNFNELDYFFISLNEEYQFDSDQIMELEVDGELRYLQTNKALVLPVFHYIKMLITSDDVIHSWSLPQLGIKVDAIPGRIQIFLLNSNYIGYFYGQCSELCGINHAFMPINVEFVNDDQFYDWYLKNLEIRPYKILLEDISLYFNLDEFSLLVKEEYRLMNEEKDKINDEEKTKVNDSEEENTINVEERDIIIEEEKDIIIEEEKDIIIEKEEEEEENIINIEEEETTINGDDEENEFLINLNKKFKEELDNDFISKLLELLELIDNNENDNVNENDNNKDKDSERDSENNGENDNINENNNSSGGRI